MGKRDEQRKQADREFEVARQGVAAMPDAWLCDALREIPHRRRIEIEKGTTVGVGILSHRAADRIAELEHQLRVAADALSKAGYVSTAAAIHKSLMESVTK